MIDDDQYDGHKGMNLDDIPTDEMEGQDTDSGPEDLQGKLQQLVENNGKLLAILKTTLELQASLFHRVFRYLFP